MKKKLFLILIICTVIIGGYFLMDQYKEKQLIKEAQNKAVEFVYQNYEAVDKVQINEENYHFDPVGGLSIGGNINDDENLYFHIIFNVEDGKIGKVSSVVEAPEFPKEKEECQEDYCE